jgi:starch synthase
MTVLFGHASGSPFSHNAALAHFEASRLEAFCVPWMPGPGTAAALQQVGRFFPQVQRLSRRHFAALDGAQKIQGRIGEIRRLLLRASGHDEHLFHDANDWLMRTMAANCGRPQVSAVHAYEDCSLLQFIESKRLGKSCIYDMPIGYFSAWEDLRVALVAKYADWLPAGGWPSDKHIRPGQKHQEMCLADLVLVPSNFVENTIRTRHPYKKIATAPYGVDLDFWTAGEQKREDRPLRFIFAGHLSLRKGIPVLIEAWEQASLRDAEIELVGAWQLSDNKRASLPRGVVVRPPCSSEALRERYRAADVFVLPSFFEGLALVLLEAMACGLPAIISDSTGGGYIVNSICGRVLQTGNVEALAESFKWYDVHRDEIRVQGLAARTQAEQYTWQNYRRCVTEAVKSYV